jgi:hypothetical protein
LLQFTDSVVLEKPLPPSHVGKELGKMKLEYTIKRGIFIRKKFYAIDTVERGILKKTVGLKSKLVQ